MIPVWRWPGFALALVVLASAVRGECAPAPPNFLVIVTDDQANWAVGCYGNREARTPHMDRLAREGARFANAFVCTPVCSPSRATFLTGHYASAFKITDWINPKEAKGGLGLPPAARTWPAGLQTNGYTTALFGKWHLGEQPQFHPTRHGYDVFAGFLQGGTVPVDPVFEVSGAKRTMKGPEPDVVTELAMDFIRTNRARPFAVQLHFRAPHMPYGPVPEVDREPFARLEPTIPNVPGLPAGRVRQWTRDYYASVHSIDRNLGRLWALLDATGLSTNTVILFTSDHGYMIGHHGLHSKGNAVWVVEGKRGTRPNMFEESIRVPFLVRWPGTVRAGLVIEQTISNLDIFPTILAMAGVSAGPYKGPGRDFTPLLLGQKPSWSNDLFGEYDLHHGALASLRLLRTPQWKLIRNYTAGGVNELYRIESDPGETENRYDDPAAHEVRHALQKRLDQWLQERGDAVLKGERSIAP